MAAESISTDVSTMPSPFPGLSTDSAVEHSFATAGVGAVEPISVQRAQQRPSYQSEWLSKQTWGSGSESRIYPYNSVVLFLNFSKMFADGSRARAERLAEAWTWIGNLVSAEKDDPLYRESTPDTGSVLGTLTKASSANVSEVRLRFDGILNALADTPVEDGMCHPAELMLQSVFQQSTEETVEWLFGLLSDRENPAQSSRAAPLLKCLGRLAPPATLAPVTRILNTALKHDSLQVRDAATQLVENWELPELLTALKERISNEPIVWLREYMEGVISDMGDG